MKIGEFFDGFLREFQAVRIALERIADGFRQSTYPDSNGRGNSGRRRSKRRGPLPVSTDEIQPDDLSRQRAKRILRKQGLRES